MSPRGRRGRFTEADVAAMRLALELAARGRGRTSPNPMVGAVLAVRGELIAKSYHARFGGAHAERRLLAQIAGRRIPRDASLYLTLEPCVHQGKTPPCLDVLLASPLRRFVIATPDPNPAVAGRGIRGLRAGGRRVEVGLLGREARALNEPFFVAHREGRARVTLKLAMTLDGMLADHHGGSRWITSPAARREVARLRAAADAIVVGRGTVQADDPRLRAGIAGPSPSRIVVDSRLSIDPDCRLGQIWRVEAGRPAAPGCMRRGNWVQDVGDGRDSPASWRRRPRLIVATAEPHARRRALFLRRGWEVWDLPDGRGRVDLRAVARRAGAEGLHDLIVEPGPALAGGFLERGAVDRILLFVAPLVLGGRNGWSARLEPLRLARAIRTAIGTEVRRFGPDLLIEAAVPSRTIRRARRSPG